MELSAKLLSFNVLNNKSSFEIRAYGIDATGKTYSILIKNMKPFFYVKIGNDWDDDDIEGFINQLLETLTNEKIQMLKELYNKYDSDKESELDKMHDWFDRYVDFTLVNKRKLYGFDNKQQHNCY